MCTCITTSGYLPARRYVVGPHIQIKLSELGLDSSKPAVYHGPVLLVHLGPVHYLLSSER